MKTRTRRTARVLLFEPEGRVLLIRFVVEREGAEFGFWAAPGGEIEPGETEAAAAERELREELGLSLRVEGPVFTQKNMFPHQGMLQDNTDFYFRAECAADAPQLAGVTADEIRIMREIRWWTKDEVGASAERIYPGRLVDYF
jgi:8-oxo-dGTP pyrophosphatase MutT (NUDIX family)